MIDGWDGFDGWGGWDGWGGGSVDIGGYWGGWEGGVVVEPGWGSVPLGEGIYYGGGYGGNISSDLGFDWGRETLGLGYDDRRASERVCVQGGVPPKCPEGQTAVWDQDQCKWTCQFTTACLYRVGTPPACPEGQEPVWNPVQCRWMCERTARLCALASSPPGEICPGGANPVWDQNRCTWVCPGGGSPRWPDLPPDGAGGGSPRWPVLPPDGGGKGDGKKTPIERVADVIERVLAGGGGGVIIPQIPQPQAVVAPATERRYNPAAIVLLVAGLALGGYYVYQRTRRS